MNSPWAKLPNAHHIDWVLKSVEENTPLWNMARWKVRNLVPNTCLTEGNRAAEAAGRSEVLYAAWDAVLLTNMAGEAWSAVLALIAYDDCDQYLNMGYEKLLVYATVSENPQAIMLLPMVYVREKIK